MTDTGILGISVVAMVIAFVQIAKTWGLETKWAGLMAAALGLVFGLLELLVYLVPEAKEPVKILLFNLGLGLAAAGLYSTTKSATVRSP